MTIKLTRKYGEKINDFARAKDLLWSLIFIAGLFFLFVWNLLFLNRDAFFKWLDATLYTYSLGFSSVLFAFVFGWLSVITVQTSKSENKFAVVEAVNLFLDFFKSVPQIIFLISGYWIFILGFVNTPFLGFVWLSLILGAVFANDVFEEMTNRISFFKKSDFYNAMLVAGISEKTIINRDILLLNSGAYLINRAVIVFSSSVFLLCSADFIISVGLSGELSLSGLPATLGNVLAHISSKEDILALRELFVNPFYIKEILTTHLQGISSGLTLIFTLVSTYKISNGLVERKKLNR